MKIYLDNCCLNRPFDIQSNIRIHLETEVIKTILTLCEQRIWQLIVSEVVEFEIAETPDEEKRNKLQLLMSLAISKTVLTEKIILRAEEFERQGMDAFDALHLSCAEAEQVDIFLSVDDKLLKKAKRIQGLEIQTENPLKWIEEVLK